MTEPERLQRTVDDARAHGVRPWDPSGAPRFVERVEARARRRRAARGLGAIALAAAVAALAWLGTSHEGAPPTATAPAVVPPVSPSVLRFADGSRATPLGDDTELYVDRVEPDAIVLVLVRGAARFEVTPGLPRAFRVRAGSVTVSVVGTVFTVRREGAGASVEVDEGRVRIDWAGGGHAEISAGEQGTYPIVEAPRPVPAEPAGVPAAPAVEPLEPARAARRSPPAEEPAPRDEAPSVPAWRAMAVAGRYDEGYALVLADPTVLRSEDVEVLMLAADCARLSGHPAESLAYLRRGLAVGRDDYRAPIIAFTLGRVLLQQLDRPAEAADAFAQVRHSAPHGSLAQDALAREVEAAHSAGLRARAHALALEYVRLYPDDVRANAVRRQGGLE